ncbi:methanogen output domain 1-containing protein [Roseivivax sp. CAU 1753]
MDDEVVETEVSLNRDVFFRRLLRDLSGTLEGVVGLEAAEGYISTVGGQIGHWINREYCDALGTDQLDAKMVSAVCVDLKKRIGGDFFLISTDDGQMVFGNRRCPFGEMVKGRTSLCMMTSNVFGRVTADNLGYARVELDETIAQGHQGCRVVVHLQPDPDDATDAREYYQSPHFSVEEDA